MVFDVPSHQDRRSKNREGRSRSRDRSERMRDRSRSPRDRYVEKERDREMDKSRRGDGTRHRGERSDRRR